ncbi:hypothetical protein [Ferribacterium limneticum]|nr:hypothetical protein [Ferribacterium limneticum]
MFVYTKFWTPLNGVFGTMRFSLPVCNTEEEAKPQESFAPTCA